MMDEKDNLINLVNSIDDISELIYVADMETYDLLYVNMAGKEAFRLDSLEGIKCYQALQQLDAPCSFCTNCFLEMEHNYNWEITNPVTGRHYFLKDRLINWNGRPARLEIAFDVTDYEKEKNDLRYALDTERIVLDCIRILYQERDLDRAINRVLQKIGQYLSADRAYIFQLRNGGLDNTYEWCREGVTPQIDSLQGLDPSIVLPWKDELKKHECIVMERIEDIMGEDVYDILAPQDIHSMVIAPLEEGNRINGYFGVDNPPVEKLRNIASLLETLRYFIMVTFQKHQDERRLQHLSLHDTLTGLYNRNKYLLDLSSFSQIEGPVGVVYLDFNGLKEINDYYGHAQGDQALKKCTEKMRGVFQDANLYRTGGDEFVIICPHKNREEFLELVEALRQDLAAETLPVALGYQWEKSAGDLKKLIALADEQMYENKRQFYATASEFTSHTRYPRCSAPFLFQVEPEKDKLE